MVNSRPDKMYFAEYLKKLPPDWVINHFLKDAIPTRKVLSSVVIEEAVDQFFASGEVLERFSSLTIADQLKCVQMYLMPSFGVSSNSDLGLKDPLAQAFLGYPARDARGNIRIFGFERFEGVLRKLFLKTIIENGTRDVSHSPQFTPSNRCVNDMTMIISLASRSLLAKKKNGKFGVTTFNLVKKLLHPGELRKHDDINLIVTAVTDFGVHSDLLFENEEGFILNGAAFNSWLMIPAKVRIVEVRNYILKEYGGWNLDLLRAIGDETGDQWISVSIFGDPDAQSVLSAIGLLHFCGIVALQKGDAGELLFKIVPDESEDDAVVKCEPVIMPDFKVILPQECPPEVLYSFTIFCDLLSLDKVYHAIIDKKTVFESLSKGEDGRRILATLEGGRAPSNVVETVREWIREFHRVSLLTGDMLITADEQVTRQVAMCEDLKPYIERITTHSLFRIKPGFQNQVRDIVRKLGFDDRMPQVPLSTKSIEEVSIQEQVPPEWTIILEDTPGSLKASQLSIRGTKYGAELKALDLSETIQVIDYALLTAQRIIMSYEGSPYVRKGIYTLTPVMCSKGVEPMVEGILQQNRTRKQFYVKKIASIGVVPQ